MKYNPIEIGDRIRKLRKDAGYKSREAFGAALNPDKPIDRKTIARWEDGERLPDLDTMLQMCDMFNCNLDHLLCTIEAKTRDIQFIMDTTGLSEGAINALMSLNKSYTGMFKLVAKQADMKKFTLGLISFILTEGRSRLETVTSRLVNFNQERQIFNSLSDAEKRLFQEAYQHVADNLRMDYLDGARFEYVEEIFKGHMIQLLSDDDDLCKEIQQPWKSRVLTTESDGTPVYYTDLRVDGFVESYLEDCSASFATMFYISDERKTMMDSLNSLNLYEIVKEYNNSLTK